MIRRAAALAIATCVLTAGCTDTDDQDASPAPVMTSDASAPSTASAQATPADVGPPSGAESTVVPSIPPTPTATIQPEEPVEEATDFEMVLESLYEQELPAREEIVELARSGDNLADIPMLAELFFPTRSEQSAVAEATAIAEYGPDDLVASVGDDLRPPDITDVTIVEDAQGCVIATATTDLLPTFNDEGQLPLTFRLISPGRNPTGWLLDGEVVSGELSC